MQYIPNNGTTPLTVSSGAIGSIVDLNINTSMTVDGANPVYWWFGVDLGTPKQVGTVILRNTYEVGAGDSGFFIEYSDTAFGTASGSIYPGTVTMGTTAQDFTFTGDQPARYWALYRTGNFTGNSIVCSEFEVYGTSGVSGGMSMRKYW